MIDNFTVAGDRLVEDDDFGPAQCWSRSLDLAPLLAFYAFDGGSRATYVNPLVWTFGVVDKNNHFETGGGDYIEETGEVDNGTALLVPNPPGDPPNAYVFVLESPPGSRLHVEKVQFRAAGQGNQVHVPRNMDVFLDGTSLGPVMINGVMNPYEFPFASTGGNHRELEISIWGSQPDAHGGILNEVEILGHVEMLGERGSVPKTTWTPSPPP